MAKKIKAYIDAPVIDPPDLHTKLIASVVAAPFVDADPVRCVTLVVHDSGKHERVFTESEVRAIMGPLVALSSARLNQITVKGVEYMEAENVEFAFGQLKDIAVRLGLWADPT